MNSHRCAHSTPAQLRTAIRCAGGDWQMVWLQSAQQCAEDGVMKNTAIFPSLVAISDAERTGYELAKDKAMTLPQRRDIVIQCHAGMLWLTIAGDAEDYFLRAGESVTCQKDRAVVVEAMRDVARFRIFDN
jgi:Protein of unknown function (DUF2917)